MSIPHDLLSIAKFEVNLLNRFPFIA